MDELSSILIQLVRVQTTLEQHHGLALAAEAAVSALQYFLEEVGNSAMTRQGAEIESEEACTNTESPLLWILQKMGATVCVLVPAPLENNTVRFRENSLSLWWRKMRPVHSCWENVMYH